MDNGEDAISVPGEKAGHRIAALERLHKIHGQSAEIPGDLVHLHCSFLISTALTDGNVAAVMNIAEPEVRPASDHAVHVFHHPDDASDAVPGRRHRAGGSRNYGAEKANYQYQVSAAPWGGPSVFVACRFRPCATCGNADDKRRSSAPRRSTSDVHLFRGPRPGTQITPIHRVHQVLPGAVEIFRDLPHEHAAESTGFQRIGNFARN